MNSLPLSGFIFHTSRCGSTLFAKALAQERESCVLAQPAPLQHGFWAAKTELFQAPLQNNEQTREDFRRLVMLLTRPRDGQKRRAFVKFISWNALYIDFILEAFPEVPAVYLYRDPVEIVASVRKSSTAILEAKPTRQAEFLAGLSREEIDRQSDTAYLASCYSQAFEAVCNCTGNRLALLDYRNLNADTFIGFLESSFGYQPSDPASMLAQFDVHSKDDTNVKKFADDTAAKQSTISADDKATIETITADAWRRLKDCSRNYVPKG